MADASDLVEGTAPVVAHCGAWPAFHDATIRKVELDGEANALAVVLILNEMVEGSAGDHLAHLTVRVARAGQAFAGR